MHPYLFNGSFLGHLVKIPTYGIFLAAAFSQAYFLTSRLAERLDEDRNHIDNIFLLVLVSAAVGGRMFHVLFENFSFFAEHPMKIFALWEKGAGFTFYGSLFASIATVLVYARRNKLSFLDYGDSVVPAVALGIALGRIGCFMAGCCWGRPTECFLGYSFTSPDTFAGVRNTPLHPVQLYGAFSAFLGFLYLSRLFFHREYPGQLIAHGLVLCAVSRFFLEFFRGDDYRGYVLGGAFSYSQLISILLLPVGLAAAFQLRKRAAAT